MWSKSYFSNEVIVVIAHLAVGSLSSIEFEKLNNFKNVEGCWGVE